MKTISQKIEYSLEVNKSIFLSTLAPYHEFEAQMRDLKDKHPKAAHFVFAYRKAENAQIIERFSDDGEPKGSSGMPILNVLRGYGMMDVAAIVVRYFGGTLLGVGGLVRAYTQSVVGCLKMHSENLEEYIQYENFEIACKYATLSRLKYLAKQYEVEVIGEEFGNFDVCLKLRASLESKEIFLKAYQEI